MSSSVFRTKAPLAMRRFMRALVIDKIDAAAIMGNVGHETAGLTIMQEVRPTVAGSRGGYGWPQFTGPRRRAFEAWCATNRLRPSSDEANIRYMILELQTSERRALAAMRACASLEEKVIAFETHYERSGVKAYNQRQRWARIALAAFDASPDANAKPLAKSRTAAGGIAAGAAAGGVVIQSATEVKDAVSTATEHASAGNWIGVALGLVIVAAALVVIYARWDDAGRPLPKWMRGAA